MIHGTPILDIKPYIAEYDSPQNVMEPLADFNLQNNQHKLKTVFQSDSKTDSCDQRQLSGCDEPQSHHGTKEKPKCPEDRTSEENCLTHSDTAQSQQAFPRHREITADFGLESRSNQSSSVAEEQIGPYCLEKSFLEEGTDKKLERVDGAAVMQGSGVETQPRAPHYPAGRADGAPHSVVPAWVREMDIVHAPVHKASFKYFQSAGEAKCAIEAVLSADPRSVYRRKLCQDRLFYFTVDIAHVTCWFGDGFAEVLRIKPASEPVYMTEPVGSLVSLGS
uniref:tRNA methyltransferase O n=1 Tax=Aotus nancymaae TaxID=37293 RepID=A0A2K5E734_AOTNA